MGSSGLFKFAVRVKEASNVLIVGTDCETIDEEPDRKNVTLLSFPRENTTHIFQKCGMNHESEFDNELEVVVECEDVKPYMDLLAIKKIDDDSPNRLQNIKSSTCYETRNTIKIETVDEVKQEFFGEVVQESNLNFDCERVEPNRKKRITKEFNHENKLKTHNSTMHNDTTHACELCGKKFSTGGNLKVHVNTKHNDVPYACDICGKTFSSRTYIKKHIDSVHKGIKYACDICGNSFSQKRSIKRHIDSVHDHVHHVCHMCRRTFTQKSTLNRHIDSMHNDSKYKCDTCYKTFSQKYYLKIHNNSVHKGIKHLCDICGKKFSVKYYLKKHIDRHMRKVINLKT